ncbi:MAG: hypothetical protein ABL952_15630, partial [Pyrinomonadaceae bacterium]
MWYEEEEQQVSGGPIYTTWNWRCELNPSLCAPGAIPPRDGILDPNFWHISDYDDGNWAGTVPGTAAAGNGQPPTPTNWDKLLKDYGVYFIGGAAVLLLLVTK